MKPFFFKREIPYHNTNLLSPDELVSRGIEKVFPNTDFLKQKLNKKEKITIYMGIDPTGPTLHLGHVIVLKKLRDFQRAGHKIILLIGDFTAQIGDPTDKADTRKKLSEKEVLDNCRLYKKQASKFISFSGPNKATLRFNSEWLKRMNFADVLELVSHMTVEQMLKRDMFEKRMSDRKPIFIHEFLYPLLQGYDSVAMNVDAEIGGNDQTFNMLVGRDLSKSILGKEKIVIAVSLLTDIHGKKMGKTENNMIAMTDLPSDVFGKAMSWSDDMIVPAFEICTDYSVEEIEKIKNGIADGDNPRDAKIILAGQIVELLYGVSEAKVAKNNFLNTFQKKGIPDDVQECFAKIDEKIKDVMVREKIVLSGSEFTRLINEGAISDVTDPENPIKMSDIYSTVTKSSIFKVGKKKFIKISVQ